MSECITGTCLLMCPEKERHMREREGLLHKFEVDEKTRHLKRPRADPVKIVKCFGRPAAGQVMSDTHQLRPGPVLLSTIRYLFTKIATRTDVDWIQIYDYVFDRLRAVRQDVVIQRIEAYTSVQLFEPLVRFHAYAAQRLCERNISEYDPKINDQHLLECIKHLLKLYDELDGRRAGNCAEPPEIMKRLSIKNNRPQMEALYIVLHIGDVTALERALSLPLDIRNSEDVRLATKISFAWYLRNYVRACRLIQRLPPILICAALCNLRSLRRNALQIMSSGYNSTVLTFPSLKLQEILLYNDISRVQADCELLGLTFTKENVLFQKAKFNDKILLANPEMYYTTKALHNFLPQILLEGT